MGENGETFGTCIGRVMNVGNTSTVELMGLKGTDDEDCRQIRNLACLSMTLKKPKEQQTYCLAQASNGGQQCRGNFSLTVYTIEDQYVLSPSF